jgi:hypothetical protein
MVRQWGWEVIRSMTIRDPQLRKGATPLVRDHQPSIPPGHWAELDRALNEIQGVWERLTLPYPEHLMLVRLAVFVLIETAWKRYDEAYQDFLDVSTRWNGDGGPDSNDPPLPPEPPPWPRPCEIGLRSPSLP